MALPSDSVPPSEPDRPAPGPEPGHAQRSKKAPDDTSDLSAGLASQIPPHRPGPPSSQRSTPKPSQVKPDPTPDPAAPVGASARSPNPVTGFLLYFLAGALFGPFLAISFGAATGHVFLITSIACGLLSAIGGKRFWQFLSRCLRVIFFMR